MTQEPELNQKEQTSQSWLQCQLQRGRVKQAGDTIAVYLSNLAFAITLRGKPRDGVA